LSNPSLADLLRQQRNKSWSACAEAAKENTSSAQDICLSWSHSADDLLSQAFQACFPSHAALFALGKLGAEELNLSSDVDLLILSADDSVSWLQPLREFQKILGDRTAAGFVFRLDFDLRPGGRQGPLVATLDQFKDYYGNYGETWERLAFVRFRAIAGDPELIKSALQFTQKFSFRRHLDFTLFEDLKQLRSSIQRHYWERTQQDVVDLKLGVGGIRDVELFTHALQVVHGGKDPSLQVKSTSRALSLIEGKNLLPATETEFLQRHYWNLRTLENFVQAQQDEQTHLLKLSENYPTFIQALIQPLAADMMTCDSIVKTLLGEAPPEDLDVQDLQKLGLNEEFLQEHWQEILGKEVLSHHKERDEAHRKKFLYEFIQALQAQGGDLPRGLLLLKDFMSATRAKATFFTLLTRDKRLLQELSWLFGHSPYLSRILCHRPELLDSFVYRSQDTPSQDMSTLLEELTEKKLLSEVINGSAFLKNKNLPVLLTQLSSTADSICQTLMAALKKEFPSQINILALGKWGGQELGFRSDLDFIFVIPDQASDVDFKLVRRFLSRLTESHRGGSIYSVDMRLRPTGQAGPLVISLPDLQNYLTTTALPWERQAYLKARWICGEGPDLKKLCVQSTLQKGDWVELNRIRQELISSSLSMDLKYSEGGLVDIELAAQAALLAKNISPASTETRAFLSEMGSGSETLSANYERLRQMEQMLQLVASENISELRPNHESFQSLIMALQMTPEMLLQEANQLLSDNTQLLKSLDPRRGSH